MQFLAPVSAGEAPALPAIGCSHVALLTDAIHDCYRSLVAAGVRTVSAPVSNGAYWAIHVLDPDGIRVELLQPDTLAATSGGTS